MCVWHLLAAALFPPWTVRQCVKGQPSERGEEGLLQLQLRLIHLLGSTPRAESFDLKRNKTRGDWAETQTDWTFDLFQRDYKRHNICLNKGVLFTFWTATCSSWPCLVQPIKTLSSRPCGERSSVASRLVRWGMQLIWTKVNDKRKTSTTTSDRNNNKKKGPCRTVQRYSFTLEGLVSHLQGWRCRVETRQAELLIAPNSSMLNLVAPVPGFIHRPQCHSPGERLQLRHRDTHWLECGL